MPTWLKVVLIIVGVMVLTCGLVVSAGAWWLKKNKGEIESVGVEARASGEAYGRAHDQAGCLDQAITALPEKSGLVAEVKNKLFLASCLGAAPRSAGFCDGVPPSAEMIHSVTWATEACAKRAKGNEQACTRLMQEVQKACDQSR